MHEFLLNTKILYGTGTPQTADFTWLILLLLVAIIVIASLIVFKKKALSVVLSLVLTFSFVFMAPIKSFGDEKVSITPSVEFEKDKPVELTITNNDDVPISINSVEIINQALPQDTTWDITFSKGEYEVKEAASSINVGIDIAAHSTFSFSVYPNVSDIPTGELCSFSFKTVSNHYTSTFINTEDDVRIQRDFDFSFNDFVTADNTQLSRKIATIETIFGAIPNTYNNFILENKSYDVSDRLSFMRTLGFQDNYYCKLWPDQAPTIQADPGVSVTTPTYEYDKNDVTSFCFNHRKINYGNRETEIINISVGATGGDFEWASNFDFGASEKTEYWDATKESGGDHTDWTNHEDHKGFDVAKTRLLKTYKSYYEKYIDNSDTVKKIILINGHSRGGGIANLLGKYFENQSQNQNIKPFTYTLAAPNVTAINLNDTDNTIFNIVNRDDLVAQFPGNVSAFYKYGTDLPMSIYEDKGASGIEMDELFESKSGYGVYNGNDPDEVESLVESSSILIQDRESAYTLVTDEAHEYTLAGSFGTLKEAEEAKTKFETKLQTYNLNYYAKFHVIDQVDGKYVIKFYCCAAFIMQDISNFVFTYKGDAKKYKPSFGYNDDLIKILLEAVGIVPGVVHSHIWTSYYLIATEYDYNK